MNNGTATKRAIITVGALLLLSGCATTSSDPNACSGYERGRLNGLKTGASIKTPDPNTEEGQAVLNEIASLEAKCSVAN